MHIPGPLNLLRLSLGVAVGIFAISGESRNIPTGSLASRSSCDRQCLTNFVTLILDSMEAHDPYSLPMAKVYKATENSHPAAIGMMSSWRTITKAGPPSLLAIDTKQGSAYFALDVSEGNDAVKNVLRGRVKVENQKIFELELFINRYRGDHGFSFSAAELPSNFEALMSPPANRTKPSRATLEALSEALFSPANSSVNVNDNCQFTEIGWKVVDTGTYSNGSSTPLGCSWPTDHPTDTTARTSLVVDEELGFVLTSGMIQGIVYPYANVSAFIPNTMTAAQEAQEVWYRAMLKEDFIPMVAPFGASGETLELLQFYSGELQAMQINVYLSGPNMTSAWL